MVYEKPYCRIQPYLIGMMLGYFMHKSYSGTRKPAWVSDDISKITSGPVSVVFYNNLLWFVPELHEKDIFNVVVQCR
jgi:hypothetical protein